MFGRRQTPAKSAEELVLMRAAGLLVGRTLELLQREVRDGMTTLQLDTLAETFIRDHGAVPNFQLVPGYRHTLCTSVNEEVVHGIPGERVLRDGDLLSVDCGAQLADWNGDAAVSLVVGGPQAGTDADRTLVEVTEQALWAGITALAVGERLYAVGDAVQELVEERGARDGHELGIVEEYVGHGIGRTMHEDPQIPNYAVRDKGPLVRAGFTGAVEPMLTWGSAETRVLADDWTVVTTDGSRAAHWEHSVAVTEAGLTVLTALDGGQARLTALGAPYAPLD
ncbi:type I methionyl aminopeptidase [Lapillicoccus jejuensis]|uniref:Methionine aminopeptidase n=1 Tax=Lapillicoccus jejuensis TaxID=402171 RepID=A0A542DWL2_9MICO|nr:type I methionyl aminopeptidase [Lapillicoccus jejuensis]TQJ07466.1 methionyl aminopeptidase [Lapillicoccus jejuensis]